MALALSREMGLAVVNSVNRYRLWGQRSVAWEMVDELGRSPDAVVLPVGNAGNITAGWAGFVQYRRAGKADSIPAMIGVQAEGAAARSEALPGAGDGRHGHKDREAGERKKASGLPG